jgi:hypothetical protein
VPTLRASSTALKAKSVWVRELSVLHSPFVRRA